MMSIRGEVLASTAVSSTVAAKDQETVSATKPATPEPRYRIDAAMDCPVLITDENS